MSIDHASRQRRPIPDSRPNMQTSGWKLGNYSAIDRGIEVKGNSLTDCGIEIGESTPIDCCMNIN